MLSEDNKQIFASKYQLHLPSKEALEAELKREMEILEEQFEYNKR